MSLHIVKKDGEWTFRREDGEQISSISWESKPSQRELATALDEEYSGASILANDEARSEFVGVVTGNLRYHIKENSAPWYEHS